MRVIAGKHRGKKLKSLEGLKTRPTLDRVKESLFNIIQFEIENKMVLDLFAGTGQLGIEALSRGALYADFIELDKNVFKILQENLKGLENCYAHNSDFKSYLKNLQNNAKYDIIFIDPPYGEDLYLEAVNLSLPFLNNGGTIICESDKNYRLEGFGNLSKTEKIYGNIKLIFLRNETHE